MEIYFLTPTQSEHKLRNLVINNGKCTKSHYHNNIKEFNSAQKTLIAYLMSRLEQIMDKYIVDIGRIDFILLNDNVYWDFPFTIGKSVIVLSSKLLRHKHDYILKVLAHEWVHLDQRRSPIKYEQYYKTLGFEKAYVQYGSLEPYLLRNPDADKYEWIWKHNNKIYIPAALVIDCTFQEVLLEIINLRSGTDIMVHKISDVKSYSTRFGTTKQLYHPNEITANLMSDFVINQIEYVPIDYDHIKKLLMTK
jgi:hypothetical protein